jgi:phosphoribosylamine--glycine ligase
MRRLESDLVPYLLAAAEGKLESVESPRWDPRACVGVVGASAGYPGAYEKGHSIEGLEAADAHPDVVTFHGGTRQMRGRLVTDGGRVLCVTALGSDLPDARTAAYEGFDEIRWDGKFCRRDIGLARNGGEALSGARVSS